MKILKENVKLQLLLSTSDMKKKCPAFHCDKGDTNAVDAMAKVKVLEEFLKNFMKRQSNQMLEICNVEHVKNDQHHLLTTI